MDEKQLTNGQKLTRTIAAGVIVLFLGGGGTYIWNQHLELQELQVEMARDFVLMAVHKADLKRLNDFMTEGERFTLERGEGIEDDLDTLRARHESLRLVVSENKLTLARMPHQLAFPFSDIWQRRVSELEQKAAINANRIEELQRKIRAEK